MKINKLIDKCIEDNADVMKVHIDVLYEYAKEYNALEQKKNKIKNIIKNHIFKCSNGEMYLEIDGKELQELLEILGEKNE